MNMAVVRLLIVLFFTFSPLCAVMAQNISPRFTNVSSESGIDFMYNFGDESYENILESSGSGVTVFDYNNDGLMDLYLLNGTYLPDISDENGKKFEGSTNALYKNNGDGTFQDASVTSGLDDSSWGMAATPVDLDQDGYQDLYLLNYGENVFLRNNGDGTFSDLTEKYGLKGPAELNGFVKWSIGAAFWDQNSDGRLDVMVGNFLAFDPDYVSAEAPDMMPHPSEYRGQASMFYEQQEDGSFKTVSKQLGLFYPDSKCMGLSVFDYDGDGDLDIFQANDHQQNFLFRNDSGKYKEVGVASGVATNSNGQETGSMHATLGDVDGDGLVDILVTDLKYGALYKNMGSGLYKDITESSGIAGPMRGKGCWGASFLDFDNDGDLDLVTANGTAEELILQYPLLLQNDGAGRFKDAGKTAGSYFGTKRSGRGLAVLDYDNDGDIDILISHVDLQAAPALLRNESGKEHHWLGLTLTGPLGLSSGLGATVTLEAGGKEQVAINQWSMGYLSNNDPRVHFGLGRAAKIDRLLIKWPDGSEQSFKNLETDKYITIDKNKGFEPLKN